MLKTYNSVYAQLSLLPEENRHELCLALLKCHTHAELVADDWLADLMSLAIPEVTFPEGWKVKLWWPTKAAARMLVNGCSVYLDMVDELGYEGHPYWEVQAWGCTARFPMLAVEEMISWLADPGFDAYPDEYFDEE